jgi:tetratricopeptide (TPR) repeat protein
MRSSASHERAIAAALLSMAACRGERAREREPPTRPTSAVRSPLPEPSSQTELDADYDYVGTEACAACHPKATARWTGSHHDLAMQAPTPETTLAAFDGRSVELGGERQRFVSEGPGLAVEVTPTGAEPTRYPVRYLFGVAPLQQVLLDLGGGRLQALTTAWDTRPEAAGGQRWFALRDDAPPGDALHWAGPSYTWNTQCADCHSTGIERGYDLDTDRFDTRYAAIDVGCEACHGPGSAHLAWARTGATTGAPQLLRPLTKPAERRWLLDDAAAIARLSTIPDRAEFDACAPCHSRRADLGPGTEEHFDDRYRLALLDEGLYFADGQIQDEVFVYGSFLQSRMHAAGVLCSDCHEPHDLELRAASVRETCTSCHRAEVFAASTHHFHPPESEAASCESCHMPQRVYMGVDARRDHRFGVPQPRLAASVGAPDPCLACHDDRDAAWAQAAIDANFGERPERWEFATALDMARTRQPGAAAALERLVSTSHGPAIVRATALSELAAYPSPGLVELLAEQARSEDALVRRAVASASMALPPAERIATVRPLLRDPIRSVRVEAVGALLGLDPRGWAATDADVLHAAIEEYRAAKLHNAAHSEALVDLAALDLLEGEPERAQARLERAIARNPAFTPAHLNLADLHRARGREREAVAVLRRALGQVAEPALVHHALGLALVRAQREDEALVELRRGSELAPELPQLSYVYAVALFDAGQGDRGLAVLEAAARRHPDDVRLSSALASFSAQLGHAEDAERHAAELVRQNEQ